MSRPDRPRTRAQRVAQFERRSALAVRAAYVVVGGLLTLLVVLAATGHIAPRSGPDLPLPNPMGGPALHAPAAEGAMPSVGDLVVTGDTVAMGQVPLDVTAVPSWTITNPTDRAAAFTTDRAQVLEGCCPSDVHVDGRPVLPGTAVTVPAGGSVVVQLPLQMHLGMDGPHHLLVPVASADGAEHAQLHVTGDFNAAATTIG